MKSLHIPIKAERRASDLFLAVIELGEGDLPSECLLLPITTCSVMSYAWARAASLAFPMKLSKLLKRLLVHCCVVYSTSGSSEHFKEGGASFLNVCGQPPSLFSLSPFPPTSPSLPSSLLTALIGRFTANSKLGGGEGRGEIGALKSGATGAEIKSFN